MEMLCGNLSGAVAMGSLAGDGRSYCQARQQFRGAQLVPPNGVSISDQRFRYFENANDS